MFPTSKLRTQLTATPFGPETRDNQTSARRRRVYFKGSAAAAARDFLPSIFRIATRERMHKSSPVRSGRRNNTGGLEARTRHFAHFTIFPHVPALGASRSRRFSGSQPISPASLGRIFLEPAAHMCSARPSRARWCAAPAATRLLRCRHPINIGPPIFASSPRVITGQ